MTLEQKNELISKVISMLEKIIVVDEEPRPQNNTIVNQPIEMLTIKECTEAVKGLSEHTVRQLILQNKIPCFRTGQGKRGKILISKIALLNYLNGAGI